VPVTVLSRCQRFDLRRIEPEVMIALLRRIADAESAAITDDALALITRAAEGSARDATSLLDQAISHGAGETSADQVRAMLGLADRGRVIDLFEMILRGDATQALAELQAQYADGADPVAVLRDLAELTHWVSIVKITPESTDDPTISPDERVRGAALAERLPMRVLTRMWQMLLKSLEEVSTAPNAMMAAEMAVIRLTHAADLPDPEALIRKIQSTQAAGGFTRPQPGAGSSGGARAAAAASPVQARGAGTTLAPAGSGGQAMALAALPETLITACPDFDAVLDLIRRMRDLPLLMLVENHLRLVRYSPGRIEFQPTPDAPRDLAARLAERLRGWTGGQRWAVSVVSEGGGPTIAETRAEAQAAAMARAQAHPTVQAALAAFAGARVIATRQIAQKIDAAPALPGAEMATHDDGAGPVAAAEEWDPFEDEE
ncbi:MAG: DNA polymerase III subunit gamma/tau, partial [Paracoccus sp. (in: a-proteobacteria)]|nr:DNA polymerase III subunit gamma/tau [Paracoccus sp. (in: a-proteobacteria)]